MHFPASLSGLNVVSTQNVFCSQCITLPLLPGWWTRFPLLIFSDSDDGSIPVLSKLLLPSTFSNVNSHTGRLGSRKYKNLLLTTTLVSKLIADNESIKIYRQVSTSIDKYQDLSTSIDKYRQVSTSIKICRQVSTSIDKYQDLSTSIFHIAVLNWTT